MSSLPIATLVSIQVGLPSRYGSREAADPLDKIWRSAIFKEPIAGPIAVTALGLFGDGHAERKIHGGLDKALLAYSANHYPLWQQELGRTDMHPGGFGENLTLDGLNESLVCIGDVFAVGSVRVQVTQPRQPCVKLARRWRMTMLPDRVVQNGRSGWYLRVLEEGVIERGQRMQLQERPHPEWTVAQASHVRYRGRDDRPAMQALADLPPLSTDWRETLLSRIAKLSS